MKKSIPIFLLFFAAIAAAQESKTEGKPPESRRQVNKIHIDALDVFDPKLPQYRSWLFRFLNSVHDRTNDSFIQRELVFKEGEYYDEDLLRESERRLRKHKFLDNVRIERVPVGANQDDIYVHTEDQWTTQVNISAGTSSGYREWEFSVEESNFLGYGKTIALEYSDDVERSKYEALYFDPQFLNTRWNLETGYQSASDGWRHTLDVVRPFYSLDTKWAYGASMDSGVSTRKFYRKGRAVAEIDNDHRSGIAFMARAWGERYDKRKLGILFSLDNLIYPNDARIIFPEALTDKNIKKNLNPIDKERYRYGGMFQWNRENFVEETYLDNFGRVEDLPIGFRLATMFAYAEEVTPVPDFYLSHTLAQYSRQLNDHQYFTFRGDFSVHRQANGVFNNVIFNGYAHYYLQMDKLKLGKIVFPRQTLAANLSTTLTSDVDAPFQISLGEDEGLRGYTFKSFTGQNSLLFNVEDRIFTPFDFRLVAVGLAAFLDAGYVWSSDETLRFKDFGLSVGVGLRIGLKKSQSARVVRIDFAVPLHKETGAFTISDQKGYSISVSSDQIFRVIEVFPKLFDLF
ncbi:BamA/TamA family outer membrane protein [bacterium]|nr:BamA/TamA family outer membrane protein [bacterium]